MRATQAPKNKKNLIITTAISVVVLLAAGYGAFAYSKSLWPFSSPPSQSINTDSEKLSTPELNSTDPTYPTDKKTSTGENNQSPQTPTNKGDVQVGISSAGQFNNVVEVRAFMSGVIEGNGTCSAIFTKGSQVVKASAGAFIDTRTTQCEPITIEVSKFEKGTWSLVVTYISNGYKGASSAMEVKL